jgi:hypothetical protein
MNPKVSKYLYSVPLVVASAISSNASFAECDWLSRNRWFYGTDDNGDMPPDLLISWPPCAGERYDVASANCRDVGARVCKYEDLFAVYYYATWDGAFNPYGMWIGNMVDDDRVLCGNRAVTYDDDPDYKNFEGTCNKADTRQYYCCYGP